MSIRMFNKEKQFSCRRTPVKFCLFSSLFFIVWLMFLKKSETLITRSVADSAATINFDDDCAQMTGKNVLKSWFQLIVIVRPKTINRKQGTMSSKHVKDIFTSLLQTDYNGSGMDLKVYLSSRELSIENQKSWDAARYISQFHWPHGKIEVSDYLSTGGLEYITWAWDPQIESNETVAIIDTSFTTNIPKNWYKFISSTRQRFSGRHDIIAYSTQVAENIDLSILSENNEESVFLWQGVDENAIIVLPSVPMWRCFLKWLERNIGDWYLWPSVVSPTSISDSRWDSFNAATYSSWHHWLSRFSVLHKVFLLYPSKGDLPLIEYRPSYVDARKFRLLRLNLDGTQNKDLEVSRISLGTIHPILDFANMHGNTVSFTIVSSAFITTAKSWICNVDVGGFRPPGIVWITTDDESFEEMRKVPDSYTVRANELEGARNGTLFGSFGYWLLMLERTTLIRDILTQGCTVFLFETDQVWLRDPFPYIKRLFSSAREIEMVGTLDAGRAIGGNFLIIKPTLTMRKIYSEVCKRFENTFNNFKGSGSSNSIIQNDQSILSKLVMYEEPFRSRYPVFLRILDTELFACGKWYNGISGKYHTLKSRSPILINNNWVSGVTKKTNRLKQFNHWFLFENDTCSESSVRNAIAENERRALEAFGVTYRTYTSNAGRQSTMNLGEDIYSNSSLIKNAISLDRFLT